MQCPFCKSLTKQIKHGTTVCGTQRILCKNCGKAYSIKAKPHKLDDVIKLEVIQARKQGLSLRKIATKFDLSATTVARWLTEKTH